ncbi:MAG: class I SAM-dependent methyltransferase [Rhodobacteraceae bacterium]|nr:class I SAM-dependent methyltransferase [Paracoccaceae bacterium]
MNDTRIRGGHVAGDQHSRNLKAKKIETILSRRLDLSKLDMLDFGAGSGLLSAHFQPLVRSVIATDRDVSEFAVDGMDIHQTPDATLPFADRSFDLVLLNHVIEHVGTRDEQALCLSEILRVLRPGGVLYLSVPSRFALIEPHYRLPFLSWLPQNLADAWVKASGKGEWYDCNPFSLPGIRRHAQDAGFAVTSATDEAFFDLLAIEKPDSFAAKLLRRIPRFIVRAASVAMPTFILVCSRPARDL